VAATFARRDGVERHGAIALAAVVLFCAPVAAHGFTHLGHGKTHGEPALTPGIISALRERVPMQDIVFSDDATAYRIAAYAPVYINAAPPAHVADTKDNLPYTRRGDAARFFREKGNLSIPRRYGARWIVIDEDVHPLTLSLPRVYRDDRYALYRL